MLFFKSKKIRTSVDNLKVGTALLLRINDKPAPLLGKS
jgi:hypothetical protein